MYVYWMYLYKAQGIDRDCTRVVMGYTNGREDIQGSLR